MRLLLGLHIIKSYPDYILEETDRTIGNGLMPVKKTSWLCALYVNSVILIGSTGLPTFFARCICLPAY